MSTTSIKICYIGGGSRQWALASMGDLALCPHIDGELVLYDINQEAAERNAAHGTALLARPEAQTRFVVRAEPDLGAALAEADFVLMSIEPGPITMRYADLEIPLRHGVVQTVGDCVGPGGTLRGLRTAPIYAGYAQAIMSHCPTAWVINYSNPMVLSLGVLQATAPDIKAIGCCHEVFGTQRHLLELVNEHFGFSGTAARTDRREIRLAVSGVNHFTLSTGATWQGTDLMPLLRERMQRPDFFADRSAQCDKMIAEQDFFADTFVVPYDMLRRLGVFGSAGSRHLVENVPWYLAHGEAGLHRWGVIRTPYQWRLDKAQAKRAEAEASPADTPLAHSGEEGVDLILALLGIAPLTTNINLPNRGQMPQMPAGAIVETMARFDRDSAVPLVADPLPAGAAEAVRRIVAVQELVLAGIREHDREHILQAMLLDPIVMQPTDVVATMFEEMCEHAGKMLPDWLHPGT
ncbi:MAG: alpha-galactosidase [Planctomycetota bacterium]